MVTINFRRVRFKIGLSLIPNPNDKYQVQILRFCQQKKKVQILRYN